MKKSICFLLTSVFCLCGLGMLSGCGIGLRLYENEYYVYTVGYDSDNISILGLTDKGREQEYLVIPETIEGKKVVSLSYNDYNTEKITKKYGDIKYSGLQSDKLRKVFITPTVSVNYEGFFQVSKNSIEVFYISNGTKLQDNAHHYTYYYTKDNDEYKLRMEGRAANVSYYYNYETASNDGYYWIDNYNYGEIIEYILENPIRDGYTFGGWYKESECINEWDFEINTLPQAQYNEDNQEIYQETKLYAKWIEN